MFKDINFRINFFTFTRYIIFLYQRQFHNELFLILQGLDGFPIKQVIMHLDTLVDKFHSNNLHTLIIEILN
jgi:hypothetical protein